MGLEQFRDELDFLTGRYATKRRPAYGRLFSSRSRTAYGAEMLEDIAIEGVRMQLPNHPRSQPASSASSYRRGGSSSGEESPLCADSGEVTGGSQYISIINPPPRVERAMHVREDETDMHERWPTCQCQRFEEHMRFFRGKHSKRQLFLRSLGSPSERGDKEHCETLQPRCHTSPAYEPPAARKTRTVRFDDPGSPESKAQAIEPSEELEIPEAHCGDETSAQRTEIDQASEGNEEYHEVMMMTKRTLASDNQVLEEPERDASTQSEPPAETEQKERSPPPTSAAVADSQGAKEKHGVTLIKVDVHSTLWASGMVVPDSPTADICLEPQPRPTGSPDDVIESKVAAISQFQRQQHKASNFSSSKASGRPVIERASRHVPVRLVVNPSTRGPPKPMRPAKPTRSQTIKQQSQFKPKQKPKLESRDRKKPADNKSVPLPISQPEQIQSPELIEELPAPSPELHPQTRRPVKMKEKQPVVRVSSHRSVTPPSAVAEQQVRDDLSDYSEHEPDLSDRETGDESAEVRSLELPNLLPDLPDFNQPAERSVREAGSRRAMDLSLLAAPESKPRWGQKQLDLSLREKEENERRAEERRMKLALKEEKSRGQKVNCRGDMEYDELEFDDDGFLGKYCIFNQSAREKYRHTFSIVDEMKNGYLTEEETALGLGLINPSLKDSDRTYLYRVLELVTRTTTDKTDLNMFCILAALSQRVSRLDDWAHCEWARKLMADMGKIMAEMDYTNLERKMFLCKTLWECNVDNSSKTISRDQLLVELRAGGISPKHESEVLDKLPRSLDLLLPHPPDCRPPTPRADLLLNSLPRSLDFFDFLLYIPLFLMIHESVVTDPLSLAKTA